MKHDNDKSSVEEPSKEDKENDDEEEEEPKVEAKKEDKKPSEIKKEKENKEEFVLEQPKETGTKRKAEILSKESGKIGVTITTSSPTSLTPPAKIPRTVGVKPEPENLKKAEPEPIKAPSKPTIVKNNNKSSNSDIVSPGSEYWLSRNPVANQVFITDVTVHLKTVTVRECKIEKGFFKDRNDSASDKKT